MAAPPVIPVRTYILVFVALIVLAILTTFISFIDLGPFNTPIALIIAAIKATLVLLFFMYLLYSHKLTRTVFIAGLFWLALLIGLTLNDYYTRAWIPYPAPWSSSAPPTHP